MNDVTGLGNYIGFAADIVSAYVTKNAVPASDLPTLINDVHSALLRTTASNGQPSIDTPKPAVPAKKSITNDFLVCLEDGRKFKSLKRHLRAQYDMSPDEYRAKWGLAPDYPMVAPSYARARSDLAKQMGFGQERRRRG